MPYNHTAIEKKWQAYWLENKSFAAIEPKDAGDMPKAYILDMFPYPSGAGLHVGHPEGYTATDIVSRYLRMKGHNVLHPMGWDAFGLPAEQYAIKNNVHPAETTRKNIDNFRKQIQMLGLSYDWDREVDTTDPTYYKWTQWIFLQLFNSYFDPVEFVAKPISDLVHKLENGNYVVAPDGSIHINKSTEGLESISGEVRVERTWAELTVVEKHDVLAGQRLAYTDEVAVNWCEGLGTVLANEEVIDGKSEVGGFPVERRPMRQWLLRITAYADRLIADLDVLQWPESLKEMQRNWIGRSVGAEVDFEIDNNAIDEVITVFTTRPDTLYGATYMVLAPEHALVDKITTPEQRDAVAAYRAQTAGKSDRDRMADVKDKTGVFTGAMAINPVNDEKIPVYIADYVLTGYGTGAIMAVPAHDDRDFAFAKKFGLPIKLVVGDPSGKAVAAPYTSEGIALNSPLIDGLPTEKAKEKITALLADEGVAVATVKYKLRDWLFSRQRYWGEPFPIVIDGDGNAHAIREEELPLTLPTMEDFKPTGTPEPPLSKISDWVNVEQLVFDASGKSHTRHMKRETNTMPQWAGSCWYYLRYIDPRNPDRFIDKEKEKYWMPVDLYVGGVEHAVLHLLYARFWHKVLFDLGHVSTPEPFNRLVNQGLILGEMEYHTVEEPPRKVSEDDVERKGESFVLKADPSMKVKAECYKMSKSRGNVVNPDDIVKDYGADAFRLYEMYLGPLESQKPWNTRDIVGMSRFLSSTWNNLVGEDEKPVKIDTIPIPDDVDRQLHRTIKKVAEDIVSLRFNTAIAELIKLNKEIGQMKVVPRELAEDFTLMLAPFAPHLAEEIWSRLGHTKTLTRRPWPDVDATKLVESTLEIPVQVNGKLRDKITVAADASEDVVVAAAMSAEKVKPWLADKTIRKTLYVPRRLVNFVVG